MELGSLQEFIDEAMRRISEVRASLRAFRDGGVDALPATELSRQIDAVQRGAIGLELEEITAVSKTAIGSIFAAAAGTCDVSRPLETLSRLETLLLRKSLEDDYLALDMQPQPSDGPLKQSDELPEFEFSVNGAAGLTPEPPSLLADAVEFGTDEIAEFGGDGELEGFEIDDELLEIFAGEAEELLQNIENSLATLASDPNDKDALWEIRRNAHTFKGSAGIVGLKQISELAHRVEDLLDRLAETSSDSNAGVLTLLRSSFDCLKALTAGETSAALFHRISQLYYDFDGVLAGLEVRETEEPGDIPPTFISSEEIPAEPLVTAPAGLTESFFTAPAEEKQPAKNSPSRSVVRVSLERLDELVGIVRDMIIGRSAFEQRIKELERQIEELHNTTRRLQTTSTKLEVDFEASMLSSDRPSLFGAPVLADRRFGDSANGFDELEFDKYTDFHQSTREIAEVTSDTFAINTSLDILRGNLESQFQVQHRLVENLHEKLMRIRMVEFGSLSSRLQRAVRVTCEEEKKKAEVALESESIDVDTQILDTLVEPLMHLLKNAVVHGIETPGARVSAGKPESGTIRVCVANEETHILVRVSDDGRGIDPEAIVEKAIALGLIERDSAVSLTPEQALDMIFLPGLSTAERLNISAGRGVGMSIVKESIEAQKGTISIDSGKGRGTTFTIRLPLPLAVTEVLIVESGRQVYAMPRKQAKQIVEVESGETPETVEIAGETFPAHLLGDRAGTSAGPRYAVVMRNQDRAFAVIVDGIRGTEDVVIKPLGQPLDKLKGVRGAAILGNGELIPIVDVFELIGETGQQHNESPATEPAADPEPVTIMIVDDSPSVRHLTSKVITGAGWKVMTAKDGLDAMEQLRAATTLPAVILSDIEMPRMDGYEFAASLQRSGAFNTIPVVMITSRSAEKHRERAFESGVSQYLTKPYDDKQLLDTIRELAKLT
jgi:chemosensory pili system protein ChpA (sensor histidine kinase/response regulator)